jgi:ketosteroid isomerase-like protein
VVVVVAVLMNGGFLGGGLCKLLAVSNLRRWLEAAHFRPAAFVPQRLRKLGFTAAGRREQEHTAGWVDSGAANETCYSRSQFVFEKMDVLRLLHIEEISMRHRFLSGLLVVAAMALMTARPAQAADDDTQAVKAAVATFHDALNTLFIGDVTPMKAIWSHADDVTYMGPVGGMQVGWSQVEPYWDKQAAKKLSGKVDPVDLHVTASPTLAVVHYYEKGENVIDGKPQPVNIRVTTTFRKEGGQWKVIGHHTDMLPFLQK